MTAQAAFEAKFAAMTTAMIKGVLRGVWTMKTPEAAMVRGAAYCALEARIGEDAADAFADALCAA